MITVTTVNGVTKQDVPSLPLKVVAATTVDERDSIIKQLDDLGISYKKNMKTETLKAML